MNKLTNNRNPYSLTTLFFTEMWERFSYYGMRALLVLYLVNSLGFSNSNALHIYAIYTGLVYLTPIIGGYLADKYLGTQKTIFIGGITMMLGHFLMIFPDLLFLAMGLLIIGNGYFKPNISTLLGRLYKDNDVRRDSGFSIFYIGINLGAFLAPLIVGYVGETINWHYGFAIAGLGMLAGLMQFYLGQNKIIKEDLSQKTKKLNFTDWGSIIFLSLINIPIILLIFEINIFINDNLYELLTLLFALVIILFLKKKNKINFIKRRCKENFLYWHPFIICNIFLDWV